MAKGGSCADPALYNSPDPLFCFVLITNRVIVTIAFY